MQHWIDDIAGLEASLGKQPEAVKLKVIDHLDSQACRWIAASPLAFTAFGDASGMRLTLAGGAAGFASPQAHSLQLPRATLDEGDLPQAGQSFAALFILPGLGETLRVNGQVGNVNDETIHIDVHDCYGHCAKALIRSDFWSAQPIELNSANPLELLRDCRFTALATVDSNGHADVSPKGDPAGKLLQTIEGDAWYADRPGNRLADSLRNILSQPRLELLALIPGSCQVIRLSALGRISNEASIRQSFSVNDKTPQLAVCLQQPQLELLPSAALSRAQLWPLQQRCEDIDAAALFIAHVKLNKARSLSAKLASAALSVPGLMKMNLEQDYKRNLY